MGIKPKYSKPPKTACTSPLHSCRRENQRKPDGTGWKLEEVSAKAFPGYIIAQGEYNIL